MNTDNFKYTVLKSIDNGETYEEYQIGNFASSVSGEEYVIMSETISANTTYKYQVYTWLDGENETSSNIQGKSFKAELRANIFNGSVVTVDVPDGMIPVTIANDGVVTSISKEDSSWYDYNNKLWANGVLVTESSRSIYLETTGKTIPENDILAYYVYVPRYKYKIWTTVTSTTGQEQEIEILFENISIPKSKGSKVGEYITHPAFTFGADELNGLWK